MITDPENLLSTFVFLSFHYGNSLFERRYDIFPGVPENPSTSLQYQVILNIKLRELEVRMLKYKWSLAV